MGLTVSIPPGFAYGEDEPLPSTQAAPDVLLAVANVLQGRVESIAKRIGMSPSTLQKKISQHVDTHHLSVNELELIQHVTGDIAPTQVLAAALGYACVRVMPAEVASAGEGLGQLMQKVGDFGRCVGDCTANGRQPSRNDLRAVQHHLGELLGCANALAAFVAAQVPRRQD